jgi:hypothetical protein
VSSAPEIRRSRRSPRPATASSRMPSFAGITCCLSIASTRPPPMRSERRSGLPSPTTPSSRGATSTCSWGHINLLVGPHQPARGATSTCSGSTTSPMKSSRIRSAFHPQKSSRNRKPKWEDENPYKRWISALFQAGPCRGDRSTHRRGLRPSPQRVVRHARKRGKSSGAGTVFPCTDSARWILCIMCRRQPRFPR